MMKNYFSDEQFKNILDDCGAIKRVTPNGIIHYVFDINDVEAIMNLAVEAAIGEPVAYCRSDTALDWKGQSINIANMFPSPKGLSNPIPLYSVKELEN